LEVSGHRTGVGDDRRSRFLKSGDQSAEEWFCRQPNDLAAAVPLPDHVISRQFFQTGFRLKNNLTNKKSGV